MKSTQKKEIGNLGESLAAKFLKKKGFHLIERNYWRPFGEIDLVMKRRGQIHFVEVKTVTRESSINVSQITSKGLFRPEDNLHPYKLKRVERAALDYLGRHGISNDSWQIDAVIVQIDLKERTAKCLYISNVC